MEEQVNKYCHQSVRNENLGMACSNIWMQILDAKERSWELHADFWEQMLKETAVHPVDKVINKWTSIQYGQNRERTTTTCKIKKLKYFAHVMRQTHDTIVSSVLTGLIAGVGRCGQPRISWLDNITTWTFLSGGSVLCAAQDGDHWQSLNYSCSQPLPSDDDALTFKRKTDLAQYFWAESQMFQWSTCVLVFAFILKF